MGTVQITSASFAALPASAPDNWPSNLTWPPTGTVNGSKTFNISDNDMLQMLSWIATNYNAAIVAGKTPPGPYSVPAVGIFLAWLQGFMNATMDATQRHHTVPAQVPPPISIN